MVIRTLNDLGVKHLFGYPGGAVLDIYDALFENSDIEHVLVRHEQAAVHMADGYARSTGQVGSVLVTSGPGATNTITGIATAYMDSIPLVVLSGQVATSLIGEDAFQETDMIGCSRPIVKHSFLVKNAEDIPDAISKAYYIAASGRPGPVVVDLPKDVQNPAKKFPYQFSDKIKMRSYSPTTKGHNGQIRKAVQTLMNAKKPVVYVGGGAVASAASELVTELVETLNLPATNTLMGLGVLPGQHENCLGMLGMHGTYEANMTMHNADVIVALGARFDDRVTNNVKKFCPHAQIIHVDIDPASISKTVAAHIPIVGALDAVLKQLLAQIKESTVQRDEAALSQWWQQIESWRHRQCLKYETDPQKIKPQQVIETLYEVTEGDAFIASDVGQHQMFCALYYPFARPRQWINSGGLGTMGFGLPAAMGVKVAHPEQDVVCVTGDGSVQMNIQELSTCLQYQLPIKIILLNNAALGMVKQWQEMFYSGRRSQSYMESMPDFVKLAEAYGHVGMRVDDPAQLAATMRDAMALKDRLVLVDVRIDPTEHVYPMHIKQGRMDEMWLSREVRT